MIILEVFNLEGVIINTFEAEHEDAARQTVAQLSFGTHSISIEGRDCFTRHEAALRLDSIFAVEVCA